MAQPELDRLIISNLADLDAATQYLYDKLQTPVAEAMDTRVATFLRDTSWAGVAKWNDKGIWLAPDEWRSQGNRAGNNFQCRFRLTQNLGPGGVKGPPPKDAFWLTQLLGIGDRVLGLCWERLDIALTTWCKAVGSQQAIVAKLRQRGFFYEQTGGSFFLPIRIDQTELIQALNDESPELALAPLADALQECLKAKPDFDELLAATDGAATRVPMPLRAAD